MTAVTTVYPKPRAASTGVAGWRTWPWRAILFLHIIFLAANVAPDNIPFPTEEVATVDRIVSASDEGMLGRRVAFSVLGIVALYAFARYDHRRVRVKGVLGVLLLAFFIWSCMSLGWAEDTALVTRKVLVFVLLWLGAGWAAARLTPVNLLRFGFLSNLLTLFTCLGIEVAFGRFRPWASGYRFAGLYHPNETGQCLVVACAAGLALAALSARAGERRASVWYAGSSLVTFLFLLMTGSRTSLLSVLCAVLAYWAITSLGSGRAARAFVAAAGACAAVLCVAYLTLGPDLAATIKTLFALGRDDSDLTTLTLRTPMWHVLMDRYITDRPLLGYGYGAFWSTKHIVAMSLLQKGTVYFHSHSGYLEMALSIGVVGAAVHVLTLLLGTGRLAREYVRDGELGSAFGAALLITLMLSMFTEPTNMSSYLMPTFLDMAFLMHAAFVVRSPDELAAPAPGVAPPRPSASPLTGYRAVPSL